ncbi:MAG: murein L,D-transpeptidase catalytic domain family protein [Alistipes sp.]|nr:murein L,D-transpeptidase catalytic domain family protein [Alistipes sp.]
MSISKDFSTRAAELYAFCQEGGYNTRVALLMDLGCHSGRRRFVVWDFQQGRALYSFPVSHGSGSARSHVRSAYAKCSNEDGSHLSSAGRALVAERYVGRYGVAYRLDGLDETNSALRKRCVVLHGWRYTTSFPIYPFPTVGSWGCPVLSRRAMRKVDEILQREQRVVLWMYK